MLEFAELVEAATGKTDPAEIDLLFKVIDKQARGYLTAEDLHRALENSGDVFVQKVQIQPSDILIPLATKTKERMGRTTQQLFDHFKGADAQISVDKFFSMCRFFLGIELEQDEKDMLTGYFETLTGRPRQGLTKDDLDRILTIDPSKNRSILPYNQLRSSQLGSGKTGSSGSGERGDKALADKTGKKIHEAMKAKSIAFLTKIEGFQSNGEAREKEICRRSFKRFLYTYLSLPTFEADNLIAVLDRRAEGFIKLEEIQKLLI